MPAACRRVTLAGLFLVSLIGAPVPASAQAELAGAAAVYEAINTIYSTYTKLISILQNGDPTPQDKILEQIGQLQQAIRHVDTQLRAIDDELAQLAYQDKREFYLQTLQRVQEYQAMSQTAGQQLEEWLQTGRTDEGKLASAENNSQLAANALRSDSLYVRPGALVGDPDVFEYRATLLPYLYGLTMRIAVVASEHPTFRSLSAYTDEFAQHASWLKQLIAKMEAVMVCRQFVARDGDRYSVASTCRNTLTGYASTINGEIPRPNVPGVTEWSIGSNEDAQNALAYYTYHDQWKVSRESGEDTLQAFLPSVMWAATPSSPRDPVPIAVRSQTGPLVGSGAACVARGPGGLTLCDIAVDAQWWTTPLAGGSGKVAGADGVWCLEPPRWDPGVGVGADECSGSPGQRWQVSEAGALRWGRNPALCLTGPDLLLKACTDTPAQIWGREWPSHYPHPGSDPCPASSAACASAELLGASLMLR
jgi:hypothetical protein